ncbi:unnamed protein product [Oppiella nova]|uniref:Uncharacterized protein n=1 Tax=Oppiella nova TaxID=334625 RepID=A0A7R9MS46_9ACAR|nr:unnamed protein product [Oppiella nova]CAG2182635.1 unnamed protein product [Oppiella nova]
MNSTFIVIAINDKIAKDNNNDILANSRPNWWQKKVDKRPTLVVSDEPTGTGVPTWKEIDMFSADERRGRSYAYRTDRTDNSSLNAHQYVPSLPVLILLNVFLFSFNSY